MDTDLSQIRETRAGADTVSGSWMGLLSLPVEELNGRKILKCNR